MGDTRLRDQPSAAGGARRIAWVTTAAGWRSGWDRLRARVEAAELEVDVICVGSGAGELPSLGSLAFPLRPLTAARLVGRLTDGGYALVHLLDDASCALGLPASRFAGAPVVVASAGVRPLPASATAPAGRFAAALGRFTARPEDATLLIAMGQASAAVHAEARRLDPLRWVLLEEGLGEPNLPAPGPAKRRGTGPLRVMVDGSADGQALEGVEVESVAGLDEAAALRKARYADLWILPVPRAESRLRALAAAQSGAALLVPTGPDWDWVARCHGGALARAEEMPGVAARLLSDRELLGASGSRAAAYVARHLEPSAVATRILAWYDDLLALSSGASGPATLDLAALGAAEGRARRDLLTGLREP